MVGSGPEAEPREQVTGGGAGEDAGAAGPPALRLGVLLVTGAIALLALVGGVAFFGFFDGLAWLHSLSVPPLVPVSVNVVYRGQPLLNATILTQPLTPDLPGGLGFPEPQEGQYTLRTDVAGDRLVGAYVGEHKVVVRQYAAAGNPPPLLSPEVYASFDTTPLRIKVSQDAKDNSFPLSLEGDPPARRGPSGPQTRGDRGGRPPTAPVPAEPSGDAGGKATGGEM